VSELDYPLEYFERTRKQKQQDGLRCVWCDAVQGEKRINQDGESYTVTVAGAHVRGYSKTHPRPRIVLLCLACHRYYDDHGCLPPQEGTQPLL
jgi:hypothetical protein